MHSTQTVTPAATLTTPVLLLIAVRAARRHAGTAQPGQRPDAAGCRRPVHQLDPGARSRIKAVYMTGYFAGAATGSALGSLAWRLGGWNGVCVAGAVLALASAAALRYDYKLARKR